MPTVYDLLPEQERKRFPVQSLTPKGQRLVSLEIPEGSSEAFRRALAERAVQKLPRHTIGAETIRETNRRAAPREADIAAGGPALRARQEVAASMAAAERRGDPMAFVTQAAAGAVEASPIGSLPSLDTSRIPPPATIGGRVARGAGSAATLGLEAAAIEVGLAAAPFFAGHKILRGAAAFGAASAAAPGTAKERAVSGATGAATAGLSRWVPGAVTGKVARGLAPGVQATERQAAAAAVAAERQIAEGMARGLSREQAEAVAQETIRGAVRASSRMASTASSAAETSVRSGQAAGLAASTVGFGALEPVARHYILEMTGEEVAPLTPDDLLQNVAALGILNVVMGGRGLAARAPRAEFTETRRTPAISGSPGAEAPAAGGVRALPPRWGGLVRKMGEGLPGKPNPIDGGRTAVEAYEARVLDNLSGVPDEQLDMETVRNAAAKARGQTVNAQWLQDAIEEPPMPQMDPVAAKNLRELGRHGEQMLTNTLVGKQVQVQLGEVSGTVTPMKVAFYPWDDDQVRLIAVDEATNAVVALRFKDAAQLRQAVQGPAMPASVAPPALKPAPKSTVDLERLPADVVAGRIEGAMESRPETAGVEYEAGSPQAAVQVVRDRKVAALRAKLAASPQDRRAPQWRNKIARLTRKGQEQAPTPTTTKEAPDVSVGTASKKIATGKVMQREVTHGPGTPNEALETPAPKIEGGGSTRALEGAPSKRVSGPAPTTGKGRQPARVASPVEGSRPSRAPLSSVAPEPQPRPAREGPLQAPAARPTDKLAQREMPGMEDQFALANQPGQPAPEPRELTPEEVRVAREAAGQADMFGGKPMLGAEGKIGATKAPESKAIERVEGEAAPVVQSAKPPVYHDAIDVQRLNFHDDFQKRQTGDEGIVEQRVQDYLTERNGVDMDSLREHPIKIWRDVEGRIGPKGALYVIDGHHRTYIASHDWRKLGSKWAITGKAKRSIPAIEIFGTYEDALEAARLANLKTAENTRSEKAQIAYELSQQSGTLAEVQRKVRLKSEGDARAHIDFFHVDPAVRERFFPPNAEDERLGSWKYGAILGGLVRRAPKTFTREIQMQAVERAVQNAQTQAQFQTALQTLRAVLEQIEQTGDDVLAKESAPVHSLMNVIERVTNRVLEIENSAARAARSLKEYASKPGRKTSELRSVVASIEAELAEIRETHAEVQKRAQAAVNAWLGEGKDWRPALHDIGEYLKERLGEEGPVDYGASTLSFMGTGPLGEWASRMFYKGTRRAMQAWQRRLGNRQTTIRVQDPRGNTIAREPLTFEVSPEDQLVSYKLFRHLRLGASVTFPPRLLRSAFRMRAAMPYYESVPHEDINSALGTEGLKWLQHPWSANERTFFLAMEGKAKLPAFMQAKADAVRKVLDDIIASDQEFAAKYGVKVPGRLADWMPHIREGSNPTPVDDFIRELYPESAEDESQLRDIRNRFHEHREGEPGYLEYFHHAINIYLRVRARWRSTVPFVAAARRELVDLRDQGKLRQAAAVRDIIKSWLFPQKGWLESRLDEALRQVHFARTTGGVEELSSVEAAAMAGMDPKDLRGVKMPKAPARKKLSLATPEKKKRKPVRYYLIRKGVNAKLGRHVVVATTKNGNRIVASTRFPASPDAATPRKWYAKLERIRTNARIASRRGVPRTEAAIQEMLEERARILRFERDPAKMALGRLGRMNLRAVLGYNLRATFVNLAGGILNIYQEWGLPMLLRGGLGASRASVRGTLRNLIEFGEDRKHLTAAQAKQMRDALPYLIEELLPEAIGAVPGEVVQTRERMQQMEKGYSDIDVKAMNVLKPLGAFGLIERFNRGLDSSTLLAVGKRMGLSHKAVQEMYAANEEGRRAAIEDVLADVNDPQTLSHFVAWGQAYTQYYYDMFGQSMYMASSIGRILGQLVTYPISYLMHQEARATEGAVRTTGAFVRGLMGARLPARSGEPGPSSPFERVAAHGGAGWFARHAFGVFFRSLMLQGALLWATAALSLNFLQFGITSMVAVGLWALRQLFPDDETFKDWWESGRYGIVSPLAGAFGVVPRSAIGGFSFMFQDGYRSGPLELVRRQLTGTTTAIRRVLEEYPELFDRPGLRALYDVMGQRTALYGLDAAQRTKHQLGLMTAEEQARHRKPIHRPPKKVRTPASPWAMPSFPSSSGLATDGGI